MAIINSDYTPYYIKSDAITVFPCANRTNNYASRFTTEYNLTHLGLPNASWISKVAGKTTGSTVEDSNIISCIINGYFFEFSLENAYDMEKNQLQFEEGMTLAAYIDVSYSTSSSTDPLEKQAQLRALVKIDEDQPTALDKVIEDPNIGSLFLGLAIIKNVESGTSVSNTPLYSLQLASSGNYPYIGIMPPMPDNVVTGATLSDGAVTAGKIAANAVTTAKITNGAVTTAKIAGEAVTEAKLGNQAVTESKLANGAVTVAKLDSNINDILGRIGQLYIGDTWYTVSVDGNTLKITEASGATINVWDGTGVEIQQTT